MPQPAAFMLSGYQFDKISIDAENHSSTDLMVEFATQGTFFKADTIYELVFSVVVFNKDKRDNPFVKVQCRGSFKFENEATLIDIPDFFYKNSIAILFPYLRAYVSLVTTQANVPGIILPTYNLSDLGEELRKNSTEK